MRPRVRGGNVTHDFTPGVIYAQVSLTATNMEDMATTAVSLVAVNFLDSGSISTFEPRTSVEVRRSEKAYC